MFRKPVPSSATGWQLLRRQRHQKREASFFQNRNSCFSSDKKFLSAVGDYRYTDPFPDFAASRETFSQICLSGGTVSPRCNVLPYSRGAPISQTKHQTLMILLEL